MYEKFEGVITLVEPMVHSDKQLGIASKFRRVKVCLPSGEVEEVPVVSGNSIRGVLRRCGARYLLRALDVEEKQLSIDVNDALFRGGVIRRGEGGAYDPDFVCRLREMVPHLSVFGSAIFKYLVPGKLEVGMAVPIAYETEVLTGIKGSASVWDLMQMFTQTRRDDKLQKRPKEEGQTATQMLYKVEVLAPGTRLHHYFVLHDATPVERAAFMAALKEFMSGEMRLGGMGSTGFGKVKWTYRPDNTEAYDELLEKRGEEVRKFLLEELPSKWKEEAEE